MTSNKCWQERGEKGTVIVCWWVCKLVQLPWETVWRFFKKLKTVSFSNPTPGYISEENGNKVEPCTSMFIAALFIIGKLWKHPKCPSTDRKIKKMVVYICV